MITLCQNCGNEFEAQRTTAKYCSDKCRVQASRKHQQTDVYFNARSMIFRIEKDMNKQDAIGTLKNLRDAIEETLKKLEAAKSTK